MRAPGLLDGIGAVGGASDHLDVRFEFEHRAEPVTNDRMIVGDEDGDHAVSASAPASVSGSRVVTVVPCPGLLTTVSVPPALRARSAMPSSP